MYMQHHTRVMLGEHITSFHVCALDVIVVIDKGAVVEQGMPPPSLTVVLTPMLFLPLP